MYFELCFRKSNVMRPRTSNKLLPYLAFIFFTAIFIFKLDVFIAQTIFTARNYQENPTLAKKNGTFHQQFIVTWGEENALVHDDGELLMLSLDRASGSGFQSRKQFMFGRIDMQIKLVSGDSAGTVTTYYMMSRISPGGDFHDEIDFEFLGNSSGNPYTLHTNVYSQGRGKREQQFFLWFDPTADFHTYSIVWNPKCIIFLVDNIPIREFKNTENIGVPYPKNQPMRLYSSLWNADEWATQHGKVKTNWELAPFRAYYRNFTADVCVWSQVTRKSSCDDRDLSTRAVMNMELDSESRIRMKRLQKKYMVYDYCKDKWRFPRCTGCGECRVN